MGSGLGIDSFIAAKNAGPEGRVIGIDISKNEVNHAEQRAQQRGANVKFAVADMENIPLPDQSFDVVISNGAFCLAPNKERAFRELFRVLKPGGRISICTSTVTKDLEAGNWPICMRMFVHRDRLEPICSEIGFTDIKIDTSNSLMQFEIPELETLESEEVVSKEYKDKRERSFVHVGSEEFKHLKDYDMNSMCARVTVIATKPPN